MILGPEKDAPPGSYRCVQLLIPDSPRVSADLDKDPKKFGLNREYKVPVMSPGAQILFELLPAQFIIAVCGTSYAEVTVIIEYKMEPR